MSGDVAGDLVIQAAHERGYVIMQAGVTLAAFASPAELAYWLQARLEATERARHSRTGGGGESAAGDGPQDYSEASAREAAGMPARDRPAFLRPVDVRPVDVRPAERRRAGPGLARRIFG